MATEAITNEYLGLKDDTRRSDYVIWEYLNPESSLADNDPEDLNAPSLLGYTMMYATKENLSTQVSEAWERITSLFYEIWDNHISDPREPQDPDQGYRIDAAKSMILTLEAETQKCYEALMETLPADTLPHLLAVEGMRRFLEQVRKLKKDYDDDPISVASDW